MRTWSLHLLLQLFRLALSGLHVVAPTPAAFKSRAALQLENLALRHQLGVLRRSVKRPKLTSADRLLWTWLCAVWSDWRSALVIVKPETGVGRLLYRADGPVSDPVRIPGSGSRPKKDL